MINFSQSENMVCASINTVTSRMKYKRVSSNNIQRAIPNELIGIFYSKRNNSTATMIFTSEYTLVIQNIDGTGAYVSFDLIANGTGVDQYGHVFCTNVKENVIFDLRLVSSDSAFPRIEWAKSCRGSTVQNFPIACPPLSKLPRGGAWDMPCRFPRWRSVFFLLENRYSFAGIHFSRKND
jgi:hypothetical protein